MTAQQINRNCLSRSTRDFFYSFFDPSSSCSLFCGLVFPPPTLPSMRQYRVFSSLLSLSPFPLVFSFFSIISLDPDHRHSVLPAEQNSKMQRRRQWRHSGRAALFVQRRVCWLRRKMAQVKRQYGEGVEELALRASTDVGYMRL